MDPYLIKHSCTEKLVCQELPKFAYYHLDQSERCMYYKGISLVTLEHICWSVGSNCLTKPIPLSEHLSIKHP